MTNRASVFGSVSLFEDLRPDELARVTQCFERMTIAASTSMTFSDNSDSARLVVVLDGRPTMTTMTAGQMMRTTLDPGDRYGDVALATGSARTVTFAAHYGDVEIATLDRKGLDDILARFPIVANPLARELASELAVKYDHVRQLVELHAERLPAAQLVEAIAERRSALGSRAARVSRPSTRLIFERLVARKGSEPPFWMLIGFIGALGGARTVVALILKYKLEKQLFALVPGTDPNPMHVHHFNYGLILIGSAGLSALFPIGRRGLRALAFAFGAGCGLVFDEFALFWNLNPEYAQSLSLIACGVVLAVLIQLVYFRVFWSALARRTLHALRGTR